MFFLFFNLWQIAFNFAFTLGNIFSKMVPFIWARICLLMTYPVMLPNKVWNSSSSSSLHNIFLLFCGGSIAFRISSSKKKRSIYKLVC